MHDTWTHELETWHEFFLLIGTAGVTLTGLLFVVVSLGPRVVAFSFGNVGPTRRLPCTLGIKDRRPKIMRITKHSSSCEFSNSYGAGDI